LDSSETTEREEQMLWILKGDDIVVYKSAKLAGRSGDVAAPISHNGFIIG
jgi:hypothetical protein